ncbi:MAG: hypothetical protein AAF936_07930 [Pseudomonadota bacterium]
MNSEVNNNRRRFTVPCTISIEHSYDSLEAHVELDGDVKPTIGDRIMVHGDSVTVPFGEKITLRRNATVTRANALEKLWLRLKSQFELTELYEVSFSPGRI